MLNTRKRVVHVYIDDWRNVTAIRAQKNVVQARFLQTAIGASLFRTVRGLSSAVESIEKR